MWNTVVQILYTAGCTNHFWNDNSNDDDNNKIIYDNNCKNNKIKILNLKYLTLYFYENNSGNYL